MKMNHPILILAFAIGLATVAWVGWAATSALAVAMTLVIGAVYLFGALEVRRFRTDTAAFTRALANVPQPLEDVQAWLSTLPASLRQTVRLRLEGERAALPALALTPYLVGLLVMLGMLGTFLGMVVTFQGAVLALESSADLAAMRAALSAPIKGLGLSFGTSVAGVASSAMLGLMAAISRRERLAATRTLESHLATALHPFSHAHQRQATYEALQQQARTLPAVVDSLQALVERMDQRSEQQHTQMLERQNLFHQDVGQAYNRLAQSVQTSLQDTLVASARAASESLKPVVETAMNRVAQDTTQLHERTVNALQTQLDGLCARWAETAHATAEGWRGHLQQQTQAQQTLVQELEHALEAFSGRFEQHATHWLTDTREALAQSAQQAAQAHREQAGQTLERMARLQAGVEELARSRIEAESRWISSHDQRLDDIAALWRNGLAELRNDEALRGQAAVDRLSSLQAEVAQHLADLGTALEAPLDRLLRTAAEVPEAAAGVISQLHQQVSHLAERDNLALQERTQLLEQLQTLLPALNDATREQRAAIESLVTSASRTLDQAGQQFAQTLQAQAGQAEGMREQFGRSADELASLGNAFAQGIGHFSATSEQLAAQLARIESALAQSLSRSDEQLAYYVAQAREVIDLSISAQQGILEDLRRLRSAPARAAEATAP